MAVVGTIYAPGTGLKLVKRTIATAAVTSIEIAAGLNGDIDTGYTIHAHVLNATATPGYGMLLPNGLSTNQGTRLADLMVDASTGVVADLSQYYINASRECSVVSHFFAKRIGALRRWIHGSIVQGDAGGATAPSAARAFVGVWNETSTNVTSLSWAHGVSDSIGIGSEFLVYKWV